jgi:hypothetical protein
MFLTGVSQKLLYALFILAGPVLAETAVVDATGIVLNDTKNILDTRKLALIAAQKAAVEEAVGVWVEAHSTVNKAILERSIIQSETEGRVLSYRILSEGPHGEMYFLKIHAVVDLEGKRFPGQNAVREALATIDVGKLDGAITFVKGSRPTEEELRMAIADPRPVVTAYLAKVESQAPNIDQITLLAGVARSLGLPHSGSEVVILEKILGEKP